MELNDATIAMIGALAVFAAGAFIRQWFIKFINRKFDSVYAAQERNEKEREIDNYITLRGQQITCDCLHNLINSALNGDHKEELLASNEELDEYRKLLNKTITEKASRYNIQIEH